MSLQNLIKQRLQEQFKNAQLPGSGELAIRNGHYYIKSVDYQEFRNKGKCPIAIVLWKPSANEEYVIDVEFRISLLALNLEPYFDYINLVNKVIVVTDTRLISEEKNGKKVSSILCNHCIESAVQPFVTLQDLALSIFMGKAITVSEAYNTFQANLSVDLTESLEIEATPEQVYDEPADEDTHKA